MEKVEQLVSLALVSWDYEERLLCPISIDQISALDFSNP